MGEQVAALTETEAVQGPVLDARACERGCGRSADDGSGFCGSCNDGGMPGGAEASPPWFVPALLGLRCLPAGHLTVLATKANEVLSLRADRSLLQPLGSETPVTNNRAPRGANKGSGAAGVGHGGRSSDGSTSDAHVAKFVDLFCTLFERCEDRSTCTHRATGIAYVGHLIPSKAKNYDMHMAPADLRRSRAYKSFEVAKDALHARLVPGWNIGDPYVIQVRLQGTGVAYKGIKPLFSGVCRTRNPSPF